MMGHVNASVEQVERALLTPDEVTRMKPPKKQGEGANERIVAPGDMLIFQAGHYPIYGTQILYFTDPVLSERAALPPPTSFYQIIDGALCPRQERRGTTASPVDAATASDGGPDADLDPTDLPAEYLEEIARPQAATSQATHTIPITTMEQPKTPTERSLYKYVTEEQINSRRLSGGQATSTYTSLGNESSQCQIGRNLPLAK